MFQLDHRSLSYSYIHYLVISVRLRQKWKPPWLLCSVYLLRLQYLPRNETAELYTGEHAHVCQLKIHSSVTHNTLVSKIKPHKWAQQVRIVLFLWEKKISGEPPSNFHFINTETTVFDCRNIKGSMTITSPAGICVACVPHVRWDMVSMSKKILLSIHNNSGLFMSSDFTEHFMFQVYERLDNWISGLLGKLCCCMPFRKWW